MIHVPTLNALGIDSNSYDPGARYRCPNCGSSRALSVKFDGDRVLLNCFKSGCQDEIWKDLREQGALPNSDARNLDGKKRARKQQEAWERQQNEDDVAIGQAYTILRAAKASREKPIAYLEARGIEIIPKNAYLLPANEVPTLPSKRDPVKREKRRFAKYPCAIFPIGAAGCHVVALNRNADGKLAVRKGDVPRRTYGLVAGSYVQFGRPNSKKPLIIAEGVETALSAAQIARGLDEVTAIATLGTSGMKNLATVPECSEVIIARDLDRPGREAAEFLAKRLARRHKVRISNPPGKRDKKSNSWPDWNDALQGRVPIEKLTRRLLRGTLVEMPHNDAVTMAEFMSLDIPQLKYLMYPTLVDHGMTMLHARSGHGKTRLALSIAYACATGTDFLDWSVDEPCRVLYVDAELPPEIMQVWMRRLGKPVDKLKILSDRYNYRMGKPRVSLVTEDDREYLAEQVGLHDPKLVILDSLFTLAPPKITENKATEEAWPSILNWIKELKGQGRHPVLLHHDNRGGSQYGSSLKEIEFDLLLKMTERKDLATPDKHAFELSFDKSRHLSPEQSAARIITATDGGLIEWESSDAPLDARKTHSGAQAKRDRVLELSGEGHKSPAIAEQMRQEGIEITDRRVRQILGK